jgi:hypothetical protein
LFHFCHIYICEYMYIHVIGSNYNCNYNFQETMAELRRCSRCTCTITLEYFAKTRKGEYCKCCIACNSKKVSDDDDDEQKKQKREQHKERKKEYQKQYNQDNRESLKEKAAVKCICETCGSTVVVKTLNRHKQSNKCGEGVNKIKPFYTDMASKKLIRVRYTYKSQKYEKTKGYAKIGIEKAREELEQWFDNEINKYTNGD